MPAQGVEQQPTDPNRPAASHFVIGRHYTTTSWPAPYTQRAAATPTLPEPGRCTLLDTPTTRGAVIICFRVNGVSEITNCHTPQDALTLLAEIDDKCTHGCQGTHSAVFVANGRYRVISHPTTERHQT